MSSTVAPHRSLAEKVGRFIIVGLGNTAIDFSVFWLALRTLNKPLLANVLAWCVAVMFSFTVNTLWSFERDSDMGVGRAFLKFISLSALISLGVSNLSIAILSGWTGIWPSKILGVIVAAFLNFLAAKWSIEGNLRR